MTDPRTLLLSRDAYPIETGGVASLLVYFRGGARAAAVPAGGSLIVGRSAPADLVVDDASLSRLHARVSHDGAQWTVEDLGSTNGTWLGGDRVERATLTPGSELLLGSVVCQLQLGGRAAGVRAGMLGHEHFLARLGDELERGRLLGRPSALLLLTGTGDERHARHWAGAVRGELRPIDRAGLYHEDTVEVLGVELGEREARALAQRILARAPQLRCGIAVSPGAGATAQALLAKARRALARGADAGKVHVAPSAPDRVIASAPAEPVAESAAMRETLDTARLLARGVIPVLLHGETGSGKEVVAREIHRLGPRADRPLVALNCGAIPPQLVESTLFGHERGAFTGANARRAGVFESAADGTLFLDEIGELPPAAQVSLLRVLDTKRFTRVGGTKELAVKARIIAATHRDLEAMSEDGLFRKDLLYRLNAMTLAIPPLRARRDDIAPLAQRFLAAANREAGLDVTALAPDASAALEKHGWPGNVRELRNAIERGVVLAREGRITVHELPRAVRDTSGAPPVAPDEASTSNAAPAALRGADEDFRSCMDRLESAVIVAALEDAGWNKAEAARRLQMPRRTLVHRIKALGLERPAQG